MKRGVSEKWILISSAGLALSGLDYRQSTTQKSGNHMHMLGLGVLLSLTGIALRVEST